MSTQATKQRSGIDQGFKINFLGLNLHLYLGTRFNSEGPLISLVPPYEFSFTEENNPNTKKWPAGKTLLPNKEQKPFGIILEEEETTLSKKILQILEFISSPKDMEGVEIKTDQFAFEIIDVDENIAQKKILLYAL